jgi:hypothetical protein
MAIAARVRRLPSLVARMFGVRSEEAAPPNPPEQTERCGGRPGEPALGPTQKGPDGSWLPPAPCPGCEDCSPERCPTCGSDDPLRHDEDTALTGGCPDSWHYAAMAHRAASVAVPASPPPESPGQRYRVGRKLGRTIYCDDALIGIMDEAEDAAMIVDALNRSEAPPESPGERWIIYRDGSGYIKARGPDLLNGPRFAEGVEVIQASDHEALLADEKKRADHNADLWRFQRARAEKAEALIAQVADELRGIAGMLVSHTALTGRTWEQQSIEWRRRADRIAERLVELSKLSERSDDA